MPSSTTLSTLRSRVATMLMDTGFTNWTSNAIDTAITQALDYYTSVTPRRNTYSLALTTALSTNGREIDTSSISNVINVIDVWCPYVAADDRPQVRKFECWPDQQITYLTDGDKVLTTDTARIFYTTPHTINGLNSATVTTIRNGDEGLLVDGATGYAALSRAVDLVDQIHVEQNAIEKLSELGKVFLARFHEGIETIRTYNEAVATKTRLR